MEEDNLKQLAEQLFQRQFNSSESIQEFVKKQLPEDVKQQIELGKLTLKIKK